MEREKMIETVMAFSPTERQIDMYGCEIGVSRQWYEEATAILIEINEGKYLKIPEGAVVLTKEESTKHDEKIRKETVKEFADALKKVFIEQMNRFDKIVAQEQKTYKYLRDEDDKAHIKQIENNANGQALMADKSIGYINKLLKEDFGVEVEE